MMKYTLGNIKAGFVIVALAALVCFALFLLGILN